MANKGKNYSRLLQLRNPLEYLLFASFLRNLQYSLPFLYPLVFISLHACGWFIRFVFLPCRVTCCPRGGETGNCDGKGLIFVIGSLDRWHMVVCLSLIKPTVVVFALIIQLMIKLERKLMQLYNIR